MSMLSIKAKRFGLRERLVGVGHSAIGGGRAMVVSDKLGSLVEAAGVLKARRGTVLTDEGETSWFGSLWEASDGARGGVRNRTEFLEIPTSRARRRCTACTLDRVIAGYDAGQTTVSIALNMAARLRLRRTAGSAGRRGVLTLMGEHAALGGG